MWRGAIDLFQISSNLKNMGLEFRGGIVNKIEDWVLHVTDEERFMLAVLQHGIEYTKLD